MSQENQETSDQSEIYDAHEVYETVPENESIRSGSKAELIKNEPKTYTLSTSDRRAGIEICHAFVDELMKMNMPDRLKENQAIQNVLAMQQSMERFTLGTMFSIVAQAAKMLEGLDLGDTYDESGFIDPHKLHAFMAMQKHVMDAVQNFNMHVRRLPMTLQAMIRDAEMSQTYVIHIPAEIQGALPANEQAQTMSEGSVLQSKMPLNALMNAAMDELRENTGAGADDYDGVDEDYAGITKARKATGEIDQNGNPVFINIEPIEEFNEDDVIDEL